MANSIKRDATKKEWESSEFPLICETCLGDNPYIRMTQEPHGKKCPICATPFTVFAWQAGSKGRWKRVTICDSCARAKNVCSCCLYDMEFGLPVAVRDKVLREEGGSTSNACQVVPQSDANRSWFNAQQKQAIANGEHGQQYSTQAYAKLKSMARMEPRYERNLPKLCTLFAKGLCNRGSACPFRHEMPKDRNDPLAKQNMKDRFYGTNDPVAKKMIWKQKQIEAQQKRAEGGGKGGKNGDGDERAIATCYVRFDTRDESTMNNAISEQDVRDNFYSHGEIVSVRMHQTVGAFVEYTASEAAELAIITMNQKSINGRKILVNWARQPKRGNASHADRSSSGDNHAAKSSASGASEGPILPKAPPGSSSSTTSLPAGFAPSAQVAAAVKARAIASSGLAKTATGSSATAKSSVPRPNAGGGPIRRAGAGIRNAAPKPYYPSSDPNRLGTQ